MATIPLLVCAATLLHPQLCFWHATFGSPGMPVLSHFSPHSPPAKAKDWSWVQHSRWVLSQPQARGAKAPPASLETLLLDSTPYLIFMTDYIRSPLDTTVTWAFLSSLHLLPTDKLLAYSSEVWAFAFCFNMCMPFRRLERSCSSTLVVLPSNPPTHNSITSKSVSPTHSVRAPRVSCWAPKSSGSWNLQTTHVSLNIWKNGYFCLQLFLMKLHPLVCTCASQKCVPLCAHT